MACCCGTCNPCMHLCEGREGGRTGGCGCGRWRGQSAEQRRWVWQPVRGRGSWGQGVGEGMARVGWGLCVTERSGGETWVGRLHSMLTRLWVQGCIMSATLPLSACLSPTAKVVLFADIQPCWAASSRCGVVQHASTYAVCPAVVCCAVLQATSVLRLAAACPSCPATRWGLQGTPASRAPTARACCSWAPSQPC